MICTSVFYQFRLYFFRISKENLSTVLRFAIDNDDKYLVEASKEIIVENFEDVLEAIPMLSVDDFCEIIDRDDLGVSCEEVVFNAIVAWYEANRWSPSRPDFVRLLRFLRVNQISQESLENLVLENSIFKTEKAARYVPLRSIYITGRGVTFLS